MKFYGVGQVWDGKKIICSFVGTNYDSSGYTIPGYYETEDSNVIKYLKENNYPETIEEAKARYKEKHRPKNKIKTLKSEKEVSNESGKNN